MINDIHDLLLDVGHNVLVFPCNDINPLTGQICLSDFHQFILDHSNFSIDDATAICSLVRLWIGSNRSYFIDKDSLIRFRLGGGSSND